MPSPQFRFPLLDARRCPLILPTLLILISPTLVMFGCGRDTPLAPSIGSHEPGAAATIAEENGLSTASHALWGEWALTIDPVAEVVDVLPRRVAQAHWNVTEQITKPACPGCLALINPHMVGPDLISVTVELTHPFPGRAKLDGFDVRGILFGPPELFFPSGTVSQLLANPDGYTARWSHDPWARINPHVDFAKGDPERRFAGGATHDVECIIRLPQSGPLSFGFAIDACWLPPKIVDPGNPSLSPHCNEAWGVEVELTGPINGHPNAFSRVDVHFNDWQRDGSFAAVTIEAPDLTAAPVPGEIITGGDSPTFAVEISNELNAPPGTYQALLCIRDVLNDVSNDALTTFHLVEIEVTDSTPLLEGIIILPEAASLPEAGSQAKYGALARFTDGGLAPIQDEVEWSIEGAALNGAELAEVKPTATVTRLTSRWWGGKALLRAEYRGFEAEAVVYCEDPFADRAEVDFGAFCEPGGERTRPQDLLGPPTGGGASGGGLGVCALGYGGVATLEFEDNVIVDGPGPDFIVFENAFYFGGCDYLGDWQDAAWNETALVEVSKDGVDWRRFPPDYDPGNFTCGVDPWANPASFSGLAGLSPVYASVGPDGALKDGIDPTDPDTAGGDAFDLAVVGLDWCRFVRLIDTGDAKDAPGTERYDIDGDMILDLGKVSSLGATPGLAGFDGDSVAAVHSTNPLFLE